MKAISVTAEGQPDGWTPEPGYRVDTSPDGVTRLAVSAGQRLEEVHLALVQALEGPLAVLYVQMVDRRAGKQLPKPQRFVGVEHAPARVVDTFQKCKRLLYSDGRGQVWVRGRMREQLVLDELGMIYLYPDDLLFRDRLEELGLKENGAVNLEDRDYVKVLFDAKADPEEEILLRSLGLQARDG